MAEKVASLYAEVTAKVDGAISGLGSVKEKLQDTSKSFGSFGESAVAAGVKAAAVFAAVVVAATKVKEAVKAAFEFGAEGAQVIQLQSSFSGLISTLGGAPDVLQKMRAETRYTVDDLTLMTSANTLLAGSTGKLGEAYANALPQLVKIAQAAHDINPALGETSFLFDSLARGIARTSPQILDNAKIIINLDKEYSSFAATLGKTRDQLTAEEKQMAVLNGVLREGNVLIEQAGSASTTAADGFARFNAASENLTNDLKAKTAPALGTVANALATLITPHDQLIARLDESHAEAIRASSSYQEYREQLGKAAREVNLFVNSNGDLVDTHLKIISANYRLSEAEFEAAKAGDIHAISNENLRSTMQATTEQTEDSAEALRVMAEQELEANKQMLELEARAVGLAAGLSGTLGVAIEKYSLTLTGLEEQHAKLEEELQRLQDNGYSPTSKKVQELTRALEENEIQQNKAREALGRTTSELIWSVASIDLNTEAGLSLARTLGLLDEASYSAATATQMLRNEFDLNKDGILQVEEQTTSYIATMGVLNQAVESLIEKGLPVTLENIWSEMESLAKQPKAAQNLDGVAAAAEKVADIAPGVQTAADAIQAVQDSITPATDGVRDLGQAAAEEKPDIDELGKVSGVAAAEIEKLSPAAEGAASTLSALKTPVDNITAALKLAAQAAKDLGSGLRTIPKDTRIRVSTDGFENAIAKIRGLASALNSIPPSITSTVTVNTNQTSTGGSSGGSSYSLAMAAAPTPEPSVQNIYNIYDPLAAAILVEQRQMEALYRVVAAR